MNEWNKQAFIHTMYIILFARDQHNRIQGYRHDHVNKFAHKVVNQKDLNQRIKQDVYSQDNEWNDWLMDDVHFHHQKGSSSSAG